VTPHASKEEIRNAYRELVKKYHPDKYRNNPLADLAQEKLKEINEAYDYLMNQPAPHGNGNFYERQDYRQDSDEFSKIRELIRTGNWETAYALLQNQDRTRSDWYFLNGIIALNRGWYQEALDFIQTAIKMDPGNPEYLSVWNNMQQTNYRYQAASRQRGYNNDNLCQLCTCLYCSDCCCECFGGDIIECC